MTTNTLRIFCTVRVLTESERLVIGLGAMIYGIIENEGRGVFPVSISAGVDILLTC
jgi:hypothetical protein